MKVLGIGIGYVTTTYIVRKIGAESYGIYSYYMAWLAILSIVATFGTKQLVLREVSSYRAKEQKELIKGVYLSAVKFVVSTSVIVSVFFILIKTVGSGDENDIFILMSVAIALLLISVNSVRVAFLRGMAYILYAQVSDNMVRPVVFMLIVFLAGGYFGVDLHSVFFYQVISLFVVFALTYHVSVRIIRKHLNKKPDYDRIRWLRSCVPFFLLSGIYVIFSKTDIIMLGVISDMKGVGLYAVALMLSGLTLLPFNSVIASLLPRISYSFSERNYNNMQSISVFSTRFSLLLVMPLLLLFYFFCEYALMMFGEEFVDVKETLSILIMANIINISFGPVGELLNMTNKAKVSVYFVSISCFLNIVLNYLLIPTFGLNGAAISTLVSQLILKASLSYYVSKSFGFNVHAFSLKIPAK
jgi:O-antigen/teichoic acid export membrane protein